jgi:hypothetical protein
LPFAIPESDDTSLFDAQLRQRLGSLAQNNRLLFTQQTKAKKKEKKQDRPSAFAYLNS